MAFFLRFCCSITIVILCLSFLSCSNEEETTEDCIDLGALTNQAIIMASFESIPSMIGSEPPAGGTIAINGTLTIQFDAPPGEVTVNGIPALLEGKIATWHAQGLQEGPVTLHIAWGPVGCPMHMGSLSITAVKNP